MPSATNIITRSLRLIGVLDATETPDGDEAQAGLDTLNEWIDGLGTQRQSMYQVLVQDHALTSGTASYTFGSGGTINVARPMWIQAAGLLLNNAVAVPTEVPIRVFSDDEWSDVTQKLLSSSLTAGVWLDRAWTAGLATLHVWPVPSTSTTTLRLYLPQAIAEFADLDTVYTFPPGYERAIRYNLALELAIEYPGAVVTPTLERKASESLAEVKRANFRTFDMPIDPAVLPQRGQGRLRRSQFLGGYVR